KDRLARHVDAVPEGAVRHLLPLRVAERLRERAARADPAAVSALPPPPHDERDDDEGLDAADREPGGVRLVREDVPDHERPGEDQAERAPVLAAVAVIAPREEVVG